MKSKFSWLQVEIIKKRLVYGLVGGGKGDVIVAAVGAGMVAVERWDVANLEQGSAADDILTVV